MSRQSFLSTAFFVEGGEQQTTGALLEIPGFAPGISFIEENKVLQNLRFLYTDGSSNEFFIDVSLISLNDGHTSITLHAQYASGKSFTKDSFAENALANFERAAKAAVAGNGNLFVAVEPQVRKRTKVVNFATAVAYSTGMFFFLKK